MTNLEKALRFLVAGVVFFLAGTPLTACSGESNDANVDPLAAGCSAGQLYCNGFCVDPNASSTHCGACDQSCEAGSGCLAGVCTVGAASDIGDPLTSNCLPGELSCSGACVDSTMDDQHCGACGQGCPAGSVCDQSACRPIGDQGCPAGRVLCNGACFNLMRSAEHCGGCGNTCDTGACTAGACSCAPGTEQCSSGCADLMADANHCGACDNPCAPGQICAAGSCACPAQQVLCGDACADTATSTEHCGACGNPCGEGEVCTTGMCQCDAGRTQCENGCADLLTSDTDCGSCGNACPGGQTCNAGSCECPTGETWCTDVCADFNASVDHCGQCGTACAETQICNAGNCECPEDQELCGDVCADTMTSLEHCGTCGTACASGQTCNAGNCECPEGQEVCDGACIDVLTDDANCGGCGVECVGGQSCQQGSCECPEGQSLCDDQCIDTTSDDLNCGGCGVACGLAELCNESACAGGGLGDDGCQGIAQGISLQKVSFYQTVEIPVMDGGTEIQERNAELVAGRNTLVRAFVDVSAGWSARQLSGRLHLDNGETRETVYTAGPQNISGPSENEDRDSTFDFMVDGALLTEQTNYALELVECGDDAGLAVESPRFPSQDGLALRAIDAGGLRIHIVPMSANGFEPDVSDAELEPYRQGFLAMYPISNIEFTVGDQIQIQNADDWGGNLDNLRAQRQNESPDDDVYYYGMLRPSEDIRDFCGGGCTAGVGYVPNGGGFGGGASARVSMGLAYPGGGGNGLGTMLHEIGHNHGRSHAPCGGPSGVDPEYPYNNAAIGVWGYDIRGDSLIDPESPDIMAYCNNPWLSDYNYSAFMNTVLNVNGVQQTQIASAERVGDFWVLLVDATGATRWGNPRPGPVVAVGAKEPAQVLDANGVVLETIDVFRTEISEIQSFSIDVPAPQPGWHSIKIAGAAATAF